MNNAEWLENHQMAGVCWIRGIYSAMLVCSPTPLVRVLMALFHCGQERAIQSSFDGSSDLLRIPMKTKPCYEPKDALFPSPQDQQ